jgi:hypothetical protein
MTLVEVLIAVVLVSVAASLVYNGGFSSYKVMMRSRARLEAQGIAFDKLWSLFNMPYDDIRVMGLNPALLEPTPVEGSFPAGGVIRSAVLPETNSPLLQIDYYEITVEVWAPSNSPLFAVMNDDGTVQVVYPEPLAEYTVLRYPGGR